MYSLMLFFYFSLSYSVELPGSCKTSQYYDTSSLTCFSCPNGSMVSADDGFACTCQPNSIPTGVATCRTCAPTDVLSDDGTHCVPRRCQNTSGRTICRKCPRDYITVTQNIDGSPLKEMNCVKCAKGYKAERNICVKCESCLCNKTEVAVRGRCMSKVYVTERLKYPHNRVQSATLLNIIKYEYFCTQGDVLACRSLANECVKSFYSPELGGPCRLWITQIKIKDLPELTVESASRDNTANEITLARGKDLRLAAIAYTSAGGVRFLNMKDKPSTCFLPNNLVIGKNEIFVCKMNTSNNIYNDVESVSPYLIKDEDYRPLYVSLKKPNGDIVQKETWTSSKFRRYFLLGNTLSAVANVTSVVYLKQLLLRLRIERYKGSLKIHTSIQAQYAEQPTYSDMVTISLRVEQEMPSSGVLRGLEVWGGVLGAVLALLAAVQWRGALRRGGHHFSLLPTLAGAASDTLYFAAVLSVVHAVVSDVGTVGLALPLAPSEEVTIKAIIGAAVALKAIKLAWINYKQWVCDLCFLDWSEYNTSKECEENLKSTKNWRIGTVAREWLRVQTIRRAPPPYTVTLALFINHLLPWQATLPSGYRWVVPTAAWWASYAAVLLSRLVIDRLLGPPTAALPALCSGVEVSVLVFEEEYYAHYVHGRNPHFSESRSLSGALSTCRIVCSSQLRAVYKQLADNADSTTDTVEGLGAEQYTRALLSKFLAAFIERALDGLGWVASERTVLERLLNVELTDRESGNISTLLYDPENATPSCFNVTWWSEEWSLATFDAMLFGSLVFAFGDVLMPTLITITVWQIMKITKMFIYKRKLRDNINIETILR